MRLRMLRWFGFPVGPKLYLTVRTRPVTDAYLAPDNQVAIHVDVVLVSAPYASEE